MLSPLSAERFGALFAEPATVSIFNAQVLAESQRLASQLSEALTSRATIDQAIGIVMSPLRRVRRRGVRPSPRDQSAGETKCRRVAKQLVEDAVRRARSRTASAHVPGG